MKKTNFLLALLAAGFAVFCFADSLLAQEKPRRWAGGIEDELYNFGFSFHYVHADYKITLKPNWQENFIDPDGIHQLGSPISIYSPFTHGVGLGLLANLKLEDNTSLRFTPNIVFSNKTVIYEFDPSQVYAHEETISQNVRASYVDLPVFFKYRSDRKTNFRAYALAGGRYSINVVSSKRYDDGAETAFNKYLKTKPGYFSYEAGIGFEFYFDFFKMSPELRWSQSVGNLLDNREPNMFNHPIERLMLRNFQISLFFE